MGHVCCMIMGLCLGFCVFFCKPVDAVERITLWACCSDGCHAQSLAATNCVTEQLNWLTVESFFMSCSISWMASLIDKVRLHHYICLEGHLSGSLEKA